MKYTIKDMENAYALRKMDKEKKKAKQKMDLENRLQVITNRSKELDEIIDMITFAEANTDFVRKYPYKTDKLSPIWADGIRHNLGIVPNQHGFELAVIGGGANGCVSVRYRKGYGAYYADENGSIEMYKSFFTSGSYTESFVNETANATLYHANKFINQIDDYIELFESTIEEYIKESES